MIKPIPLGRKGTPLDWRQFDARCLAELGRVQQPRTTSLNALELYALGFMLAAAAMPSAPTSA